MSEIIDLKSRREAKIAATKSSPGHRFSDVKPYYIANTDGGDDDNPVLEVHFNGIQYKDTGILPAQMDLFMFQSAANAFGMSTFICTPDESDIHDTYQEAENDYKTYYSKLEQKVGGSLSSFIKYSVESILEHRAGKHLELYITALKLYYPDLYVELFTEDGVMKSQLK